MLSLYFSRSQLPGQPPNPHYSGLSGPYYSVTGHAEKFKLPPVKVLKVSYKMSIISSMYLLAIRHKCLSKVYQLGGIEPEASIHVLSYDYTS